MTTNPIATPTGDTSLPMQTPTTHATTMAGRWNLNRGLVMAGAVLPIVTPLLVFGLGALFFLGPLLLPSLVALVVILVRVRPWTYLTAAIVGTLFPLFAIVMFGFVEGFLNALDAAPYLMFLVMGASIALLWTGAIFGFRQLRSGEPPVTKSIVRNAAQRFVVLFLAGLLIGATATSFAAADRAITTMGGGYDFQVDETITVVMKDFHFAPEEIVIQRGVVTEILVENQDRELHTFTYVNNGIEYDHEFLARQSFGFLVLFPEEGTFQFWCKPHAHEADGEYKGMVGKITVVEGTD